VSQNILFCKVQFFVEICESFGNGGVGPLWVDCRLRLDRPFLFCAADNFCDKYSFPDSRLRRVSCGRCINASYHNVWPVGQCGWVNNGLPGGSRTQSRRTFLGLFWNNSHLACWLYSGFLVFCDNFLVSNSIHREAWTKDERDRLAGPGSPHLALWFHWTTLAVKVAVTTVLAVFSSSEHVLVRMLCRC